MSLTRHLGDPSSPVSRFLTEHLPGDALCTAYRNAARTLHTTIRPPASLTQIPWTLLGTAVDTRIRIMLGESTHPGTARGVEILRRRGQLQPATVGHAAKFVPYLNAAAAGDLLLAVLAVLATEKATLTVEEELHAAAVCLVAARFETIYRAPASHLGSALAHFTELRLLEDRAYALSLLTRETPRAWSDDIRRQNDAATRTLGPLKSGPIRCSIPLEGAHDVGHAEPDVLADRLLLDIKATIHPYLSPSQALSWFHQLAGYLLLDYSDQWKINEVGFYLSRQKSLMTWGVHDFLRLMGARAPLHVLRSRLKQTLAPHRPKERP